MKKNARESVFTECVYVYACMCACKHVQMYVCMYACTYMCADA